MQGLCKMLCQIKFRLLSKISNYHFCVFISRECINRMKIMAQEVFKILYGPRQANLVLIAYTSSEGSGEPAHPRSLARTFAARSYKQ